MAVYRRGLIIGITVLFVLVQLCSASSPSDLSSSNENKIKWYSSRKLGTFLTSEDGKVHEREDLVSVSRSCPNLSAEQLYLQLLIRVHNQISRSDDNVRNGEKTSHPLSGAANTRVANWMRRRIVYPIQVNRRRKTMEVVIDAAEINGRLVLIKFRLPKAMEGHPLCYWVRIELSNIRKESSSCVNAMEQRYYELLHGKYYDSNDKRQISFDISPLIGKVLRNAMGVCEDIDTAKIAIKVNACNRSSENDEIQRVRNAYLEILPGILRISPSTPLECTPGETRCCRQKATVKIRDLGGKAHNVIQPLAFRSAYCRGTCKGGPKNGLCCVPTKTIPLSVLYLGQSLEVKVLRNVVVSACGCR